MNRGMRGIVVGVCASVLYDLFAFDLKDEVTRLNAHAPEILQDEEGDWCISSVECPYRGVSIARLVWE